MWFECERCGHFFEQLHKGLCYECDNERERSETIRYDRSDLD